MLLIYGALGVVGNFIAGPFAAKSSKTVVVVLSVGIALTLALFPIWAATLIAGALLMAAWGFFYGGVSVSTQTWIAHAAPHTERLHPPSGSQSSMQASPSARSWADAFTTTPVPDRSSGSRRESPLLQCCSR
ncbi:hypothetical protein GCM10020255_036310 [Rhodococcus baikonurensis]